MAINPVTVFGKITAALINQIIAVVNATALNGIIPTVAGTGVSVSAGGCVSFTNAASVTIIGAFSGTYDNYRVVWTIPNQTANADLEMRMTTSGTDDVSPNYAYMRGYDRGATSDRVVNMVTAASVWLLTAGASATQKNRGYMDLFGPALSSDTAGLAQAAVYNSMPNMYTTTTNLYVNTSTVYDGFSLFPASGTITGTLRIYGYNNLT